MNATKGLFVETRLEGPDLLLEPIHPGLQLQQLGTQGHLVELLLNPVELLFNAIEPSLYRFSPATSI
jgi:hypothetical protein